MKKYCKVCQSPIPEKRVQLGYADTCINHSQAFKYVGFVGSAGKVDYQVSIVRDKETAEHMQKLTEMRGMS
jgi:hypothetical protein